MFSWVCLMCFRLIMVCLCLLNDLLCLSMFCWFECVVDCAWILVVFIVCFYFEFCAVCWWFCLRDASCLLYVYVFLIVWLWLSLLFVMCCCFVADDCVVILCLQLVINFCWLILLCWVCLFWLKHVAWTCCLCGFCEFVILVFVY